MEDTAISLCRLCFLCLFKTAFQQHPFIHYLCINLIIAVWAHMIFNGAPVNARSLKNKPVKFVQNDTRVSISGQAKARKTWLVGRLGLNTSSKCSDTKVSDDNIWLE